MAENYNSPLLAGDQSSESYQAIDQPNNQPVNQQHPVDQPQQYAQQPQYGQTVPQYGQPLPQYGQPQPHYGQQLHYDQPINQPYGQPVDPHQPIYAQQPTYQMGYAVPVGQPAVVVLAAANPGQPGHIQTFGEFSDGLCDCCNAPVIALLSWFFPCYRWPVTISRLGFMTFGKAVALYGGLMLAAYILSIVQSAVLQSVGIAPGDSTPPGIVVLQIAVWICAVSLLYLGASYRGKIRARYNIHGSSFGDVCTYLWCSCCAIAQEARHVDRDYGLMV